MEGEAGQEDHISNQKEVFNRQVSFCLSFVLAIVITWWYYSLNPPDSKEMQKMRLFFKENVMDVAKFIRLPNDELQGYAALKSHPFYQTYVKSSEVEKEKIRALIHISRDYNPNQYWFNLVFLWTIAFATIWFLGLILEAIIILVRRDDSERRERINKQSR